MDQTAVVVAFYALAVVTLGSASMVAMVRDLIHAVLFLILTFIGIAGLYITLSADFVAVVQILIYAGAISVLLLFAILLTPRASRDNASVSYRAPISMIAGLLGVVIVFVTLDTEWATVKGDRFENSAGEIGRALLDPYVLPFEVASIVLVVAMVGAIMLVHPGRQKAGTDD